jgi:hypothetical protein
MEGRRFPLGNLLLLIVLMNYSDSSDLTWEKKPSGFFDLLRLI